MSMCVVIVKSEEFIDIHVIKPIDYLKNLDNIKSLSSVQ